MPKFPHGLILPVILLVLAFAAYIFSEVNTVEQSNIPTRPVIPAVLNTIQETPKSFEDAKRIAAKDGKSILLVVSATWCGPCQKLKSTTLSNPEVKNILTKYVVWIADGDKETGLKKRLGVTSYPTYFILSDKDDVYKRGSGYKSPTEFKNWINN